MTTLTLATRTDFYVQECIACGVQFAMPNGLDECRRRDHKSFYCPNGHAQIYSAKSEEEKLRDELARVRRDFAAESTERQLAQRRVKKLEARAKGGMCAECGRTFPNYARHMASKHGEKKAAKRGV